MFQFPDLQVILRLVSPGSKSIKIERFTDTPAAAIATAAGATTTSPVTGAVTGTNDSAGGIAATLGLLSLLLSVVIAFAASFGASRLSWCYNMYLGNSTGISIFYAILAFFFAGFYYPFYALFLNPVCSLRMAPPTIGGRRR